MRILSSIRWKIILTFIFSGISAIVSVYILIFLAIILSNYNFFYRLLRFLENRVGVMPIGILVGIFLFVIYFFLLSQRSIGYLEEITNHLNRVAAGEFDVHIPVRGKNELGVLADNINNMSKQLEKSLQEERNAEKTKSELVTSVSHDLRTPLTSILGYLELIVNDRYKDETTLRYYTDIAYNKALHLKNLIDELFEFTRVNYGGMKINLNKIDIVELIKQLVEDFAPQLEEAEMRCRLSLPHKKVIISVDANMIVRVLENLITNAIRYGKDGKFIHIHLEEEEEVIIKIENYGEPIPSKDLPYIFERFYRVEKSRSKDMGGAGLGLAIAKSIIDLHNGEISANSSAEGTIFEIRLKK